ncbi:hypothetical protein F2Q68_00013277 [Brassica cretica]|uniref:Uncharacterized protein n=1 Tax=Brassica cretica TaxID=69181 RepID=A0A8S9HRX2_BRACR|nr:hypothetical protein F2Q68_00013277 [Brassica cretica]
MVRRNSIGKYRWNSDDFAVNRNVVGISSEYTDELPTTTTVTFFIGMSSEFSDEPYFVGIPSEMADGIPTTYFFWIWSEICQYSVTNVRRPWCLSEPPSEFDVFSCSDTEAKRRGTSRLAPGEEVEMN